jgi:hypothetical protein
MLQVLGPGERLLLRARFLGVRGAAHRREVLAHQADGALRSGADGAVAHGEVDALALEVHLPRASR